MFVNSILTALAASSLLAGSVDAVSGFLPTVTFSGASCSGNPLSGFAAGGRTDFGSFSTCNDLVSNTPVLQGIVGRCRLVDGSDGLYSQKVQCYGNDTYLPCFSNVTGPTNYAVFNIYSDSACSKFDGTVSQFVGVSSLQEGKCLPLDYSKPTDPPFVKANCTAGYESFKIYQDKNCSVAFPLSTNNSAIALDNQCSSFPLFSSLYLRGSCTSCPKAAPPPPPSGGLSPGAIAGIVVGSVAGVAALGGLAYALTRKKREPVPELPLEASKPVTTVKEVVHARPVELPVVTTSAIAASAVEPVRSASFGTASVPNGPTLTTTTSNIASQYVVGGSYSAAGAWNATKPSELNVRLGDLLTIQEINQDNWCRATNSKSGLSGWVPLSAIKGGL